MIRWIIDEIFAKSNINCAFESRTRRVIRTHIRNITRGTVENFAI